MSLVNIISRIFGLLPGTAIVVASDAPTTTRIQARILKAFYGDRVGICDGVADDVEIQAALDAIIALGGDGGKIVFSEGTFWLDTAISLDSVPNDMSIMFQGQGALATLIRIADTVNINGFEYTVAIGTSGLFFASWNDMKILGRDAATSGSGISITEAADCEIVNVFVEHWKDYDIYIERFWNLKMRGCVLEYGGTAGLRLGDGFSSADAKITGNKFIYNYGSGVILNGRSSIFSDNYFYYNQHHGLQIITPGGAYNTVTGNVFESNGVAAANTYDHIYTSYWYNTIVGNSFRSNSITRRCVGQTGSGHYHTITGNTIVDAHGSTPYIQNIYNTNIVANNLGYIASGEVRTASGLLTAGVANAICFAWNNPEKQDILIKKVVIEVTTAGGTVGSHLDVGIADDATGTNRGVEFFDDLDLNAAQIDDSWVGGDGGTQTKWVFCQDSASAIDDWIVGQILDANAASLVGKYYIEYVGR